MLFGLLLGAGCASAGAPVSSQEPVERTSAQTYTDAPGSRSRDITQARAPQTAASGAGFDARLSEYAYPYPVEYFEFTAQRQPLEMAYMDVQPADANGEVVVLLHGKNFTGAYWKDTITALAEKGYRVVVPDQVGFGKSSKPEFYQFTIAGLADNTHRLLESLGVSRASFVVHSMGGMIGARYALMFPDEVDKLVMVNPIGLEDWAEKVPYLPVDTWYERELKQTPDGVRAYMTDSYFDGNWKPEYEPLIEVPLGWLEGPDYARIAWNSALTYEMIFTQPVVHEFRRIQVPTLLIIGGRDRTALGKGDVPPEVRQTLGQYATLGQRTAAAIPGAKLLLLDGIGHLPQFEAYPRYIQAVLDFLADE